MKKPSFSIPSVKVKGLSIPTAWKIFVWVAIAASLGALGHDGFVFYKYGLGWQKDLVVPQTVVQNFDEKELDNVLGVLKAREQELQRLATEGVQISNLFITK